MRHLGRHGGSLCSCRRSGPWATSVDSNSFSKIMRTSLQTLATSDPRSHRAGNPSKDVTGIVHLLHGERSAICRDLRPRQGQSLQVPLNQITDALQVYMGSVYVNDFDFNNRAYRVYVQADQQFRSSAERSAASIMFARPTGAMIPLRNPDQRRTSRLAAGDQPFQHFQLGGN